MIGIATDHEAAAFRSSQATLVFMFPMLHGSLRSSKDLHIRQTYRSALHVADDKRHLTTSSAGSFVLSPMAVTSSLAVVGVLSAVLAVSTYYLGAYSFTVAVKGPMPDLHDRLPW